MNIGLTDSELNFNFRLFCKTVSKSANWGFDRFRLYSSKWHTKVQVRRPDGSIVATKDFASGSFEHDFSFDLSGNINNEEYSVYIAGVAATSKFVQVYAFPTGFGGTYGRNAEITFWDFSQVNLVDDGANGIGRIRFENQPITSLAGISNIAAGEIKFNNCQLDAETLADALIAIDNSGVLNGSFNYSGNLAAPAERALTAYNNLKDNKGWALTGEVPSDVPAYEAETTAYMNSVGIADDTTVYYSKTGKQLWGIIDDVVKYCKAQNIWSDILYLHPVLGTTATQRSKNLKNPSTFPMSYFGSWTFDANGNRGNGSNAYAKWGFIPSAQFTDSIGIAATTLSDSDTSTLNYGTILNGQLYIAAKISGKSRFMISSFNSANQANNADANGIYVGTLSNANNLFLKRDDVQLFTNSIPVFKSPTEMFYGAVNNTNGADFFTDRYMGSHAGFKSATAAKGSLIYEALRRIEVGLGRKA